MNTFLQWVRATAGPWLMAIVAICILLFLAGCSAPRTKAHSTLMDHQTEGRVIYREANGKQYFVECEYGFKYFGIVGETRVGPVDVCEGEEE